MKYFVFRNMTVERLFPTKETLFSGYEDISTLPEADRYVWCYLAPYKSDQTAVTAEIAAYADRLQLVLSQLPDTKMMIALTMRNLFPWHVTAQDAVEEAAQRYNQTLRELAQSHSNLKIIDFSGFISSHPAEEWVDWKYYYLSQMPVNPRLATAFVSWFQRQIDSIELKRKKCLVLDLDNTLWGGILGEDGINGIQIGNDYPGNAYLAFQRYLLELSKAGVILTVCSKNNEADVLALWHEHPANVLRDEHFAARRINWQDKATNIRELARELNIGLDSMVFVDDNPTERELVKQMLPEVSVPDFPSQPYQLPRLAQQLVRDYFTVYTLTDEDRTKTEQYRSNAQRAAQQARFTDLNDYLRSLEIRLTLAPANPMTIERVAQMTQKTNQFNLTTKRYTDADIQQFIQSGARVVTLSVADKFGDNGITGLIIVTFSEHKVAVIDTLLMSCRILGKGIETAFVDRVLRNLFAEGIERVEACYLPTAKNSQVADFYPQMGFTSISNEGEYALDATAYEPRQSDCYTIVES